MKIIEPNDVKSQDTGNKFMDWFWTIFGGTILSTTAVLLVTVLNYFNGNINSVRTDAETSISQIREEVNKNEQKVAGCDGQLQVFMKQKSQELDSLNTMQKRIDDLDKCLREQIATLDKNKEVTKERIDNLTKIIETLKESIKEAKTEFKAKEPQK